MQFVWCGETELPAGWALQPHHHDFYHLAYVHAGRLIFHADGQSYPLTEGSAILIPPGVDHAVPEDGHNLCTQYEVLFRLSDRKLQGFLDGKQVLVFHKQTHLGPLFSYICNHYKSLELLCSASVNAYLQAILFAFLTGNSSAEDSTTEYVDSGGYSPLIQRILFSAEKESDRKFDLAALALSLGFNKNYLCTAFRKETGVTISAYVNYHRIRKVLITLQYNGYNKDYPIRALADQFGYGNASYFNRVFKKYTGLTPTEFLDAFAGNSAFQKYYNEYLDLKRYPVRESLAYMQGLGKLRVEIGERIPRVRSE